MEQAKLNKILDEHKLWLQTCGEKGKIADLRYADLRYVNLRSVNLRYADLRYADLRSADLSSADLSYADLRSADLSSADLRSADLSSVNLRSADLRYADLRSVDLDFSAFPLWCGGLDIHIDDRQATQLLYHLLRNVRYSKNTSKAMKKICRIKSLVNQANKFHRVNECGKIESESDTK